LSEEVLPGLVLVLVLGLMSQWLAWRLRLPSILLLLIAGFLAGPVLGLLHPDALLGDLLLPLVSFSVAVILFEGGLSLRLRELREIGRSLIQLVTVGALVAWVLGTLAARSILGMSLPLALLLGAILVVTGPTVVGPLLRHVRPRGPAGALVKWEGILNDPIGAILAMLVFEAILAGGVGPGSQAALAGVFRAAVSGTLLGAAGATLLILLLRSYRIPEYLENPFTLMLVLVVFVAADGIQKESGLLATTIMGILLANQRRVAVRHIVEFKENLRVLLISSLFILLAARIDPSVLLVPGWEILVFLGVLIGLVRPASVWLGTMGAGLGWREKVFLSSMAPRGIVAAAISAVFALRLELAGYAEAEILVPVVFLVIVGTVLVYGLSAGAVARWLGLGGRQAEGVLILGAHSWARHLAEVLKRSGIGVLLVDNNQDNVRRARLSGLPVLLANGLAEDLPDRLPMEDLGKLLAVTANDEVNSLAALHFEDDFGKQQVYQLAHEEEEEERETPPDKLRGRVLFDSRLTYSILTRRFRQGQTLKVTRITDKFPYERFRETYGDSAEPLFLLEQDRVQVRVAGEPFEPRAGQDVVALVEEPPETSGG